MSNIVSITPANSPSPKELSFDGLVAALQYDPHLPRCFEGVKHNLASGRPVLMRLHSAANYPTAIHDRYDIDQEGQAILIVGYDNTCSQFAVVDPYVRDHWEGAKVSWLDFDELELMIVDASRGVGAPIGTLDTDIVMSDRKRLQIEVGLPFMRGTFMDHDSMVLEEVRATVCLEANSWREIRNLSAKGIYRFGQHARFDLALPEEARGSLTVRAEIKATLVGIRPYEYRDTIGLTHKECFELDALEERRLTVNG